MLKRLLQKSKALAHRKGVTEENPQDLSEEDKRKVCESILILKSCDDFSRKDVYHALEFLDEICWLLTPGKKYEKLSNKVVDFMLEQGLAQLTVNILQVTTDLTDRHEFMSRCRLQLLLHRLICNVTEISAQSNARTELVKSGIISTLLKDLDSCEENTSNLRQRIRILDDLMRLLNFTSTADIVPAFRSANAVPVLTKYIQVEDVTIKVISIRVLSYLIDEKESECLTATSACMLTLLDLLQKTAKFDKKVHRCVIKADDIFERTFNINLEFQMHTLRELVNNDTNKKAMAEHGGIAALCAILRPEYEEREKQAAAEVLWKLAFLEDNRFVMLAYLTKIDKEALQGKLN